MVSGKRILRSFGLGRGPQREIVISEDVAPLELDFRPLQAACNQQCASVVGWSGGRANKYVHAIFHQEQGVWSETSRTFFRDGAESRKYVYYFGY